MAGEEKHEVLGDKEKQMVRGEKQEVSSEPQPHMSEKSKAAILRNHAAKTSTTKDDSGGLSRVIGLCLGMGMVGGGVWYWRRSQQNESASEPEHGNH